MRIEGDIIKMVQRAVRAVAPDCKDEVLSGIYLEVPKEKRFGDFSTNVAMRLRKELRRPPLDIAGKVVEELKKICGGCAEIDEIKVERPGFINFYISNKVVWGGLKEIIKQGEKFGRLSTGKGKKVQIEFVSANPTGPLTVAHGRQAAVGDSLARIMENCGYKVTREYYLNDEGVQMTLLGKSVEARYQELSGEKVDFPEGGYRGEYIYEIAKGIKKRGVSQDYLRECAYKMILEGIKKDLKDFGVEFDAWYSQKKLSASGKIKKALGILKDKGFLYEKDGATWFASTRLGDDKDRVVIKNDSSYTYLAPDIAYHKEKFEKGYERIINIWGPDHHGYVNRVKAACQALGFDKAALSILILQLVTLYRDKKPVRMSTREGEFVTLREVIDEVGKDAGRFFFIMRRTDSHLDFDLELAKSKTMDNPVYYIQYAHARIASIIEFSGTNAPSPYPLPKGERERVRGVDLQLLDKPREIEIIKRLMQYPKTIEASARNLEPYTLLAYLQELASLFHSYYDSYRIVTDGKVITKTRISLIKAIKTVLSSGLTLLGVTAPEKM